MKNRSTRTRYRAIPLCAFLLLLASIARVAMAADVNVIKSIRTVAPRGDASRTSTPPPVEIELTSSREFPVRAAVVVMRVGGKEFTNSRVPEDGRLDTLIFTLPSADWANTNTGDRVTVYYGRDDSGDSRDRWEFGTLDKSRLNR